MNATGVDVYDVTDAHLDAAEAARGAGPRNPAVPAQRRPQRPVAELLEDVEWMAATGETWLGAARRLAMPPANLERALSRAGRADLTATLKARRAEAAA